MIANAFFVGFTLTFLVLHQSRATDNAPDTILYGGRIFTAERSQEFVRALAIQGDRIVAIGDSKQIMALAGERTRRIDLGGRTVIPGLNDAHNHMQVRPANTVELEFSRLNPGWSEVKQVVAAAVPRAPKDAILAGTIGGTIFSDPRIDRAALDRLSPEHALILTTFTGHGVILNSRALAKADIQENMPNAPGAVFERDSKGRLNGVLREYATIYLARKLGDLLAMRTQSRSYAAPLPMPHNTASRRCKSCRKR